MMYAEAAYFDGAHVQHIADYYEAMRTKRIEKLNQRKAREGRGFEFGDLANGR